MTTQEKELQETLRKLEIERRRINRKMNKIEHDLIELQLATRSLAFGK